MGEHHHLSVILIWVYIWLNKVFKQPRIDKYYRKKHSYWVSQQTMALATLSSWMISLNIHGICCKTLVSQMVIYSHLLLHTYAKFVTFFSSVLWKHVCVLVSPLELQLKTSSVSAKLHPHKWVWCHSLYQMLWIMNLKPPMPTYHIRETRKTILFLYRATHKHNGVVWPPSHPSTRTLKL